MESIWEALGFGRGACVAFIGAGGKTTSILALADEARSRGLSVVVTTTTRIWPPPGMPLVLQADEDDVVEAARRRLRASRSIAVGSHLSAGGKVVGLDPSVVRRLVESQVADIVLCEADGAAGRPLKVHAEHEPVVPSCATLVAVVGGMDALGRMPGPEVIHRFERYEETVDLDTLAVITAAAFAEILLLATSKLKNEVPVVFILNKADEDRTRGDAAGVAAELGARLANPTVVVASHRGFIERRGIQSSPAGVERAAHATN